MSANFYEISHLPDRTIVLDNRQYLYFSGTSYLGLPQNQVFQNLIEEGLQQYGSVYGSSRNGNLQLSIYQEAEDKLAAWTGAEAALTLSSGMLAGQAVVRQLLLEGYEFIYSSDVHPAVWHLPDITPWTVGSAQWKAAILLKIEEKNPSKLAIVTNSVDSLRGKLHDFEWINNLPKTVELTLVIDDSHGIGVTGTDGRGILSRIPTRENVRVIVTTSLAKAMGLAGGAILADHHTLQNIRNSAYFGGCSPMAPHQLYAYLNASTLYADAYARLQINIQQFISSIQNLNLFSFTEGYPVLYAEDDRLYAFLLKRNIFIYSFSYPKPTDRANTRIVISAWHTYEDLYTLSLACRDFIKHS